MKRNEIYIKRGASKYDEQRWVAEIIASLEKKPTAFVPARNKEELKALHLKLCAQDVEFEEDLDEEEDEEEAQKVVQAHSSPSGFAARLMDSRMSVSASMFFRRQ
mgnify:CR=1 FL=1